MGARKTLWQQGLEANKGPADLLGTAVMVAWIATAEVKEEMSAKNRSAVTRKTASARWGLTMFRFTSTSNKDGSKTTDSRPMFGMRKLSPRLESAFVFPASGRPQGLNIDSRKKIEKPVPKKP